MGELLLHTEINPMELIIQEKLMLFDYSIVFTMIVCHNNFSKCFYYKQL